MDAGSVSAPLRVLILPSCSARQALPPDAIILTCESGWSEIGTYMSPARAAVVPVVDASGGTIEWADAQAADLEAPTLARALVRLEAMFAAVNGLPCNYFETGDPRRWLLARLATRERAARPVLSKGAELYDYPDAACIEALPDVAEDLLDLGFVQRRRVDALKICAHCHSAQLHLRLCCATCRSAQEGADCQGCAKKPALALYCCTACRREYVYEDLQERAAYQYELTESGRKAAFSTTDLHVLLAKAPEAQAFYAAMTKATSEDRKAHV